MKKINEEEKELSPKEVLKDAEEFMRLNRKTDMLVKDLALIIDKHVANEYFELRDYLFALSKISSLVIDNIQEKIGKPEAKDLIINEFLQYFTMNLSHVDMTKSLFGKMMKSGPSDSSAS